MITRTPTGCHSHGWLDSLAIGMSALCAVHCLLTPVLVVALPVLATTLWVQHDFHLWMMLFVLPTSGIAVFLGCRKHRDRATFLLSVVGLSLLAWVAVSEVIAHSSLPASEPAHCAHCAQNEAGDPVTGSTVTNLVGALLLSSAHVRNFSLCRKVRCRHDASSPTPGKTKAGSHARLAN
jgi:hypothetical protein